MLAPAPRPGGRAGARRSRKTWPATVKHAIADPVERDARHGQPERRLEAPGVAEAERATRPSRAGASPWPRADGGARAAPPGPTISGHWPSVSAVAAHAPRQAERLEIGRHHLVDERRRQAHAERRDQVDATHRRRFSRARRPRETPVDPARSASGGVFGQVRSEGGQGERRERRRDPERLVRRPVPSRTIPTRHGRRDGPSDDHPPDRPPKPNPAESRRRAGQVAEGDEVADPVGRRR